MNKTRQKQTAGRPTLTVRHPTAVPASHSSKDADWIHHVCSAIA